MNIEISKYLLIRMVIYLLSSVIIGLLAEKILLKRIGALTRKTKWIGDDIIIESLKGMIIFWSVLAGSFIVFKNIPFEKSVTGIANKIFFLAMTFSVCLFTGRVIVGFIKTKTSGIKGLSPSNTIISNIIRLIVYSIGILIILQTFGISISPILTALGVGGLAIALALQGTLSNLFSGIQVIASQQISTGDYVKLESEEEGYVTDISWRSTTIRALSNNLIIVPNSKIASAIIRNYQLPDKEVALLVEVGVSYDSDLDLVEKVTIQAAKNAMNSTDGGVKDFEPFIRYHTFGNFSINFTTIMRVKEFADQYAVKHEFVKELQRQFKKNSIEIPFPIQSVYLKQKI